MLDAHRRWESYWSTGSRDVGSSTSSSIGDSTGEHKRDNASLRPTTHFDVTRTDHDATGREGDYVSCLWTLTGRERAGRDSQGTRTEGHSATRKRRGAEPGQDEQRRGTISRRDKGQCDRIVADIWTED